MPHTQAAETTYCTKLPAAETTVAAVTVAAASLVRVGLVLLVRLRLLVLLVGDDVDRRPRERREGGVLGLALPEEKARDRLAARATCTGRRQVANWMLVAI